MSPFMNADFLLPDDCSKRLYHDYAAQMPIIDYHCHLPPADIASNATFRNLAHAWLGGDHYKWRAMRSNGVPEQVITGHEPDYQTFLAWAQTVPRLVGNPLYHWTHLELQRYFGIFEPLSAKTAPAIWEACNAQIVLPEFGARSLLQRMNVRAVGTTDDPADSLEHHIAYAAVRQPGQPVMVPSFRPDRALATDDLSVWQAYIDKLGASANVAIGSYQSLITALDARHAVFHSLGCRASDHGLAAPFASFTSPQALEAIFAKLLSGNALTASEADAYKTAVLLDVGRMNAKRGWAMQLHLAAVRNLNSAMFKQLGPDTGYDAVNDEQIAAKLGAFMNALQSENMLPKTILYSLNPNDLEVLGTVMGCFQDGSVPGKIQMGSAWWFNDHMDGMRRQMISLGNLGVLSRFVGMLTDSRSFLSFPRHEYFRRILCGLVGGWMENGEIPSDFETFGGMVQDISFRNAKNYFAIPGVED
ncbi:glucuronate isomerase [Rhodoferax sp. U11-2br]|uniref:glucuronate isomerase n=1 Tax=Rhodoferax sp. U11-2br TaxID=2838878 RepID=UPI001BEB1B78|nr:glucuronate isomerase [Rhodoferax sp. U11-2br]MBT3068549.1 glucuronate isomerase [Rhodoferax sp. U11-2br]